MKPFLLAALAALSVTVQAQDFEHVGELPISDEIRSCLLPREFTKDRQTQFITYNGWWSGDITGIDCIYDMYLNKIKESFALPGGLAQLYYYSDFTGVSYITECKALPIFITQTLFDEDDSYEYLSLIREDQHKKECTGVTLRKDDGEVITSIDFGNYTASLYTDDYSFQILRCYDEKHCKDIWYLAINLRDKDYNSIIRFYSFEKGKLASTIKQVKDVRHNIKATPALPKANELVKVDLGDMKSPQTLSVVNANGVIVSRMILEEGQKEACVSTHGLPAGMYVIRVSDGKTESDNCKIIIR